APLVIANGVLFTADAGGRVRGLDAASGAELFSDRLTLTLPDPAHPGAVIEVGQFVTALAVAHGRLYVAHGLPIPGVEPGGVTVYALPPRADDPGPVSSCLSSAAVVEPGGGGPTPAPIKRSDNDRGLPDRESQGMLPVAILIGPDVNAWAIPRL